jgi:hypothetical protein
MNRQGAFFVANVSNLHTDMTLVSENETNNTKQIDSNNNDEEHKKTFIN